MIFNTDFYEIFIPPLILIGIAALVSFIITYFSIPVIVRIAKIKGFMDKPNGRTSHIEPTPNLGGVAIFAGTIISSVLFTGITEAHELKYIIASMIVLFFLGLKDDFYPLVAFKKFIGQTIAVLIIIVPGDLRITSLYGLFGIEGIPYLLSLFLTLFFFIAIINSFNLIDGIDGLASGVGILASTFFGLCFFTGGHLSYAVMSVILAASLIAFFIYNVFGVKNKIFLGDTGSLITGLLVAVLSISFLDFEHSEHCIVAKSGSPAVVLSVLIVPIIDTVRVFVLRIFRGKSPFVADRNHIHHRLLDLSGSHKKATMIIISTNMLFIIGVLVFNTIQVEILIISILVGASIISYIPIFLINKRSGAS